MARRGDKAAATSAPPRRPDFEFCVPGPPVSARARNRQRLREWSVRVTDVARAAWPEGKPLLTGDVDVRISEFSDFASQDRDNMAKPILDALQGVAYRNDSQIKHLNIDWCDINGSYIVRHVSPIVAEALSLGREFLWVRVLTYVPRKDLI